jgi:hypothetical protein
MQGIGHGKLQKNGCSPYRAVRALFKATNEGDIPYSFWLEFEQLGNMNKNSPGNMNEEDAL